MLGTVEKEEVDAEAECLCTSYGYLNNTQHGRAYLEMIGSFGAIVSILDVFQREAEKYFLNFIRAPVYLKETVETGVDRLWLALPMRLWELIIDRNTAYC